MHNNFQTELQKNAPNQMKIDENKTVTAVNYFKKEKKILGKK